MHIVGLLGMPRRVYTYMGGLGWDAYNLSETIGAFVLTAGLLLIAANLIVSRVRGAPAGNNPFGGPTLEWTTTSPPPPYNFAVIPTVRSEYPGWDDEALAEDHRRLELGIGTLEKGHGQPETTVRDGFADDVVEMPSESGWPIVIALLLTIVFALTLTSHYVAAGAFVGLAALSAWVWLWKEPAE